MALSFLYLPYGSSNTSGYITSVTPTGFTEDRIVQFKSPSTDGWNATMANFWIKFDDDLSNNQTRIIYQRDVNTSGRQPHKIEFYRNSSGQRQIRLYHAAVLPNVTTVDPLTYTSYLYDVRITIFIDSYITSLTDWNNFHVPWIPASHGATLPTVNEPPTIDTLTSGNGIYINGSTVSSVSITHSNYTGGSSGITYTLVEPYSGLDMQIGSPTITTNVRFAYLWIKEGTGVVDGTNFYSASGPGAIDYGSDGSSVGQTPTLFLPFNNSFEDASTTPTPNWKFTSNNNASEAEIIDVSLTLNSTFDVDIGVLRYIDGESSVDSSFIASGEELLNVEDYVATTEADYVTVDYYTAGYAQNDPYVEFGYIEDYGRIIANVLKNVDLSIAGDSAIDAIGGNAIYATAAFGGDGAVTVTAKGSLTAETDLASDFAVTASAGLTFSQETALATDTATTADAGLTFSQTVSLAADSQVSPTGGVVITAASSVAGDAEISATVDVVIGSLATITSDSAVDATGGFFITGAASIAGDLTVTPVADVIVKPGADISGDSALTASAKVDVYGELDVTGDGAVTVTAKGSLNGDIDVTSSFQFSAIATLDIVAESTVSAQTATETLGGLIFSQAVDVASDFQSAQTAKNITGTTPTFASDFASEQDATLLINGISSFACDVALPDVEPFLLVGGLADIFQSTSTVVSIGSYTYDVPLIRRLTIPRDARSATILQETGILGVKSETRINTVIIESRMLQIPQDDRTHKIYDGSL